MEVTITKPEQLAFPFEIFEQELLNPLNGQKMNEIESYIASLLLEASSEKPIQIKEIIEAVKANSKKRISERKVKDIIRSLRRNHAFPVLSRKEAPAGYWWCQSIDEMKEFAKLWQSQYFDEMRTLYVMMKHNFPRLAGQMRLSDIPKK